MRLAMILAIACVAGCGGPAQRGASADEASWPGRLHRLPPWGWGAPGLKINVPEGYEKGLRAEEEFLVHLLRRPPDAAPAHTATMGVYVDAEAYVEDLFKTPTIWRLSIRQLVVHVFIWGTDKAQVEALMEAARSLRLDAGK